MSTSALRRAVRVTAIAETFAGAVLALLVSGFAGGALAREASHAQAATEAADALLDRLVGEWVLSGTLAGKQTVHDVSAKWTLNGNYVRLEETSRDRDARGRPAYQATIFVGWDSHKGHYVCIWLDSTAVASGGVTCTAEPRPNAIPFVFRDQKGRRFFENTFLYDATARQWKWELDDVDGDKRTAFARLTLRRK